MYTCVVDGGSVVAQHVQYFGVSPVSLALQEDGLTEKLEDCRLYGEKDYSIIGFQRVYFEFDNISFKRDMTHILKINEHLKLQNMNFPVNLLSYI